MRRISLLLLVLIVSSMFVGFPDHAQAATFRSVTAQVPATPNSTQSVRVWMNSDTALGETAGLEYRVGTSYTKVLATYDTSYAGANWRADIPAQPSGIFVEYQLFTRNQSGSDYGFTGFNWSYTVNDGDIQWDGLRHNTFDSYYRSPFGAVAAGSSVTLRFRTLPLDVTGVQVRVYQYNPASDSTTGPTDYAMSYLADRVENGTNYAIWTVTLTTPSSPAILYYKFRVTDRLDVDWFSDSYVDDHDNLNQGGEGVASDNEPFSSFQITVYDPAYTTPAWLQNANVYQIFPDRFRNGDQTNDYCVPGSTAGCPVFYGNQTVIPHTTWNEAIYDPRQPGTYFNAYGNQFYGGDLQGIIEKLDYLQSLGINTLYLTPIFTARSNHRYDADNFMEVDPALGGNAAFEALVAELDRRGMYLMLDGVFNHTSSDSLYFDRYHRYATDGACEATTSTYRHWYAFLTNNTPCGTGDYEGWFGYDSLAVLEDGSAAVRDYIYRSNDSVVKTWYDAGANGWRFDVADEITHNWWRDFRGYAKTWDSNGPLVGEVWYDASKFLLGDQLDSVMNYRFRKNILGFARNVGWKDNDNNGSNEIIGLTPSQFDTALRSVREDYPAQATNAMLNLIDSHDTNRALYVLTLQGDNGLTEAKQRLALTALFQFTYMGAPMIYYGDEAAIDSPSLANGVNGPEDDPYNRAPYPWADEAGDPNVYGPADAGLIDYYSQLAHLRLEHASLRTGSFTTLLTGDTSASSTDNNTFAFARSGGGETGIVVLNNGSASNTASVPVGSFFADGTNLQDALNGTVYTVSGGNINITLAARSGAVLFLQPSAADVTAPVPSISPSGSAWFNRSVSVDLSATDAGGSGVKELRYWLNNQAVTIASGSFANIVVSTEGTTTVNLRAVDNAGNISARLSQQIKIDLTNPTISGAPTTLPDGDNGWYTSDVTIDWACNDNLSGIASCPADTILNNDGENQTATASVTDNAGNSAAATSSPAVNIDNTKPTITASVAPVANTNGWNNGNVTVSWTCADNLSGIASCSGSTTITAEGTTTVTGTAKDMAGNSAFVNVTIKIDRTAPTISGAPTTAPNSAGWYNTNVTVAWTCLETGSGLAGGCPADSTISTEGTNQTASGTATDNAGNSATASVQVNIDKTAPSTTGSYVVGATPDTATVTFNASDATSGINTTTYQVNGGAVQTYNAPFSVTGYGSYTITYRSTDNADNVETTKTLTFTLSAPVANKAVRPVLECVTGSGSSYVAWFGYQNDNSATVNIPLGGNNKFSPKPENRSQPTNFAPGRQIKVFSVPFNGKNLTWTLKGPDGLTRTATASSKSTKCSP